MCRQRALPPSAAMGGHRSSMMSKTSLPPAQVESPDQVGQPASSQAQRPLTRFAVHRAFSRPADAGCALLVHPMGRLPSHHDLNARRPGLRVAAHSSGRRSACLIGLARAITPETLLAIAPRARLAQHALAEHPLAAASRQLPAKHRAMLHACGRADPTLHPLQPQQSSRRRALSFAAQLRRNSCCLLRSAC